MTAKEGQWDKPVWEIEVARAIQKDEYTDAEIAKKLNSFDEESINELKSYPCLFAYESYLNKDVRFGRLKNIKKRSNKLRVDYELVEISQRVSSPKIEKLKLELDCATEGELNRTHWAVKDVDLLKVLIKAEILDENIDRDILDKLSGNVSVGSVNMSDKNFEWLKKQEFCPEVIKNLDINFLRKSIAPKATVSDWEYIRRCLKSKNAIYQKEKIAVTYEVAMNILGDIKKLTKFKDNFVFDLLQINGKSFGDSGVKQYLLISTPLFMLSFDDFSPIEVADNYYDVLTKVLTKYSGRQTITSDEFNSAIDENVEMFKTTPVKETAIRQLTIAGLLERQATPGEKINFQLDYSPGRLDFEEWLTQLFEYKFQIRNSENSSQITDVKPKVNNVFSINGYTDVVLKVLGMAADLRKNSKTPEDRISTNLLFSATLISGEPNDQRNSASAILDYLKEDYKSKSLLKTDMHSMDLMKLSSRYGINNRLIMALPVDEIDFEKLSIGSKFALDVALNKYARQISPGSKADLRHLVAALLFSEMPNHEMGIQKFIFKTTQINRDGLKNIFMDYISATRPKEFEAWRKILDSPAKGSDEKLKKKETVPIHPDDPTSDDKLQRRALAEVLFQRIEEILQYFHTEYNLSFRKRFKNIIISIWNLIFDGEENKEKKGAFLIHLNGAWGSGKSTFIGYLKDLMKRRTEKTPWVVVEFNAWQHQRLSPPWWFLINSVFLNALKDVFDWKLPSSWFRCLNLLVFEYFWRLRLRPFFAFGVVVFYGAFILFCFFPTINDFAQGLYKTVFHSTDSIAQNIDLAVKLIIGVGGLIFTWTNALATKSTKAAEKFIRSTSDPLEKLKDHYRKLVEKINLPICILIDDLDRCQAEYVVELLEGIQTLFRDMDVIYVAIADRNWLCASYAKVYQDFTEIIDSPGKPLGYYYIDKIFQLSFTLPPIGNEVKTKYWKTLISPDEVENVAQSKLSNLKINAKKIFSELPSSINIDDELNRRIEEVTTNQNEDIEYEKQALRNAAVSRFNEPDSIAKEIHILEKFVPLLEPNPRFMKRLVNEYSMDYSIDRLYGGNIKREKLALWAILKLRWPLLAEHFLKHPEDINLVDANNKNGIKAPKKLEPLFKDVQVINVIKGKVVKEVLDVQTIKKLNYSESDVSP